MRRRAKTLRQLRPVYIVGIGLHPYQRLSETPYVELGLAAVREALADAGLAWSEVESAYVGTGLLGLAPGRPALRHLGASGLAITQVENASASGSTALRQASLEVASGVCDVALALGVDKPLGSGLVLPRAETGIEELTGPFVPATHFALLAVEYMARSGATAEQLAAVAVKNHRNGAHNPFAQRRRERSLEEVLKSPIAGPLTRLQCCPVGEGAAALLVASEDAIEDLRLDAGRAVRVLASVTRTERIYPPGVDTDAALTRESVLRAYDEAQIGPDDLDVVELHDAFSVEELLYLEAMELCPEGGAAAAIAAGDFDIGGRCAVSASGGLLAMGHPIGPTGAGQAVELTRQLRGEAGVRQQPRARHGLAHMVGLGAVCVVHVLEAPPRTA